MFSKQILWVLTFVFCTRTYGQIFSITYYGENAIRQKKYDSMNDDTKVCYQFEPLEIKALRFEEATTPDNTASTNRPVGVAIFEEDNCETMVGVFRRTTLIDKDTPGSLFAGTLAVHKVTWFENIRSYKFLEDPITTVFAASGPEGLMPDFDVILPTSPVPSTAYPSDSGNSNKKESNYMKKGFKVEPVVFKLDEDLPHEYDATESEVVDDEVDWSTARLLHMPVPKLKGPPNKDGMFFDGKFVDQRIPVKDKEPSEENLEALFSDFLFDMYDPVEENTLLNMPIPVLTGISEQAGGMYTDGNFVSQKMGSKDAVQADGVRKAKDGSMDSFEGVLNSL